MRGQVEEGFAALERGWALARAAQDAPALVRLAGNESGALLKLGQFQRAADVALRGLDDGRRSLSVLGFGHRPGRPRAEALLALGRTAEAAALIDPLTTGRRTAIAGWRTWSAPRLTCCAAIPARPRDGGSSWDAFPGLTSRVDFGYDGAPRAAEAMLWAGRPGDALRETRRALARFNGTDLTILSGRFLTAGMRACADLAGQARARRDQSPRRTPRTPPMAWPPGSSGWAAPRSPTTRPGHHRGRAGHLGRRADPGGRARRSRCLGRRGQGLAGPELPAPGRVRVVAAGRGAAGRRAQAAAAAAALRAAAAAGGHAPCWPRSAPWPSGPGSRCRPRRPPGEPEAPPPGPAAHPLRADRP